MSVSRRQIMTVTSATRSADGSGMRAGKAADGSSSSVLAMNDSCDFVFGGGNDALRRSREEILRALAAEEAVVGGEPERELPIILPSVEHLEHIGHRLARSIAGRGIKGVAREVIDVQMSDCEDQAFLLPLVRLRAGIALAEVRKFGDFGGRQPVAIGEHRLARFRRHARFD